MNGLARVNALKAAPGSHAYWPKCGCDCQIHPRNADGVVVVIVQHRCMKGRRPTSIGHVATEMTDVFQDPLVAELEVAFG